MMSDPDSTAWMKLRGSRGLAHKSEIDGASSFLISIISRTWGMGSIPVSAIRPAKIDKIPFEAGDRAFNISVACLSEKTAVTFTRVPSLTSSSTTEDVEIP